MATTKKQSRLERLNEYVNTRAPGPIGKTEWEDLRHALSPISDRALRNLLREVDMPMEPLVAGVDQTSLASLEASLAALLEVYRQGQARECRRLVIQAKDHARWASVRAKDETKRSRKSEMVTWMLVWLENPEVFPAWLRLRKQVTGAEPIQP